MTLQALVNVPQVPVLGQCPEGHRANAHVHAEVLGHVIGLNPRVETKICPSQHTNYSRQCLLTYFHAWSHLTTVSLSHSMQGSHGCVAHGDLVSAP